MVGTCVRTVDDSTFEDEVIRHPGRVLVDFYTPICSPCKKIAPVLERACQKSDGAVKFVKLDASQNMNTALQYSISFVPTLILFEQGMPIAQLVGDKDERQIADFVSTHRD